jgi:hypothetical protein
VAHWQPPRAHEAAPAGSKSKALDRSPDRIGPIEHPHGLAELRDRFKNVTQGRDKRVNTAPKVLQIDEQHVKGIHRRRGWMARVAVQAEDGNAVHRIFGIRRLDHVVLLFAAQAVLRPERRNQIDVAKRRQRIQRMH